MIKRVLALFCCALMAFSVGCTDESVNQEEIQSSRENISSETISSVATSSESISSVDMSSETISSENSSSEVASSEPASSQAAKPVSNKVKITFPKNKIPISNIDYIPYIVETGSEDFNGNPTISIYKQVMEEYIPFEGAVSIRPIWERIYAPVPQTVAIISPANGRYEKGVSIKDVVTEYGTYKLVLTFSEEERTEELIFEVYDDFDYENTPLSTDWYAAMEKFKYPVGTEKLVVTTYSGNGLFHEYPHPSLYRLVDDEWVNLFMLIPQTNYGGPTMKPNTSIQSEINVKGYLDEPGAYWLNLYYAGETKADLLFRVE